MTYNRTKLITNLESSNLVSRQTQIFDSPLKTVIGPSVIYKPKWIFKYAVIGPSGVRALPLGVAAERSVLYFWDFFFFFSSVPHTYLPEGVVLGL